MSSDYIPPPMSADDLNVYLQEYSRNSIARLAILYGFIIPGYTLLDYLRAGADPVKQGYETGLIWGVQGSGKSSKMLQLGYGVLKNWDNVLKSLIFKPQELVSTLEAVPDDERLAILLWDDIGVHYPSSKFKTDVEQYEAVDSSWASIRTKVGVILTTIPVSDRLAKNVEDNVTLEIFLGPNQREQINRCFRLPGMRSMDSNFFKAHIESGFFNLYDVPRNVWDRYWVHRVRLAREALQTLKGAVGETIDQDLYIPAIQASRILELSPNSIAQYVSRGIVRGTKINKVLHILEEDLEELLAIKQQGIGGRGGDRKSPSRAQERREIEERAKVIREELEDE